MEEQKHPTDISALVAAQKSFFATGKTRDLAFRREQLQRLYQVIQDHSGELEEVFRKEMNKGAFEAYSTEIGLVLEEIRFHLKHLRRWARPRRTPTPLLHFRASSRIVPEPYGTVLILSPWNYPFLLLFSPLIGALSAGNCVVLKPTSRLPMLAGLFGKIIEKAFEPEYVTLLTGGHDVSSWLLEEPFDHIFFTGSTQVGRKVMAAAARHLTPVTLELGGKNPCIVHHDAHLEVAARRIVWGKFINAGQTCIAPDHLLVHEAVREKFIPHLIATLERFYGKDASKTDDLTRIVGKENVRRLAAFIREGKVLYGGHYDPDRHYVAPTLLDGITPDHAVMQEEIFGPVLPLLTYRNEEELFRLTRRHPDPLALYIFSRDRTFISSALEKIPSGTVAINETVMQFVHHHLPFGGRGKSGMGAYHGRFSFDTFSHYRGILDKKIRPDIPLRYPPYTSRHLKWIRRFLH